MLGLAQFGRGPVDLGARIDQFFGFEHIAAVVALVGAGAFEAADVAGPFHVAVGQEFVRGRRVPLHGFSCVKEAVLLQRQEDGLGDLEMVLGVGGGEQVVGDAQFAGTSRGNHCDIFCRLPRPACLPCPRRW